MGSAAAQAGHSSTFRAFQAVIDCAVNPYAGRLGAENVIAGADCGFGSRIHPELGWAKLAVLAEGAALASSRIWKE